MVTLAELEQDPHPALAELRPVGWVDALGGWVVSGRQAAMTVMRAPDTFTVDDPRFSTAQVVGPSMLSLDGAGHTAHRAPFEQLFGLASTRQRFTALVTETVGSLVAEFVADGTSDLRRTLAGPLSVAVVAHSLGLPVTSAATVLGWYAAIVDSVSGVAAGRPVTPQGAEAFAHLHAHITSSLTPSAAAPSQSPASASSPSEPRLDGSPRTGDSPRTSPSPGNGRSPHTGHSPGTGGCPVGGGASIKSAHAAGDAEQPPGRTADQPEEPLIVAASRSGLSVDEVVANAAVLMFGGIETTEGMLTNALWHLLTTPGQLDLVRADPTLLPNALEESLRLEPAAAVVDRYATRDTILGPAKIRRGDLVVVSLAGAGRDPEVFPDPDRFDVRRPNARRHLAFASGPHICLGMHLARLESLAALEATLTLPDLRLSPTSPPPQGLVFRKPSALVTTWTPPTR